jgi:hypothetical protein
VNIRFSILLHVTSTIERGGGGRGEEEAEKEDGRRRRKEEKEEEASFPYNRITSFLGATI